MRLLWIARVESLGHGCVRWNVVHACRLGASSSSPKYVHEPRRLYSAGAAYAMAGLLAAVGMIIQAPSSSFDSNGLVILRRETWIGKPFPLAEHLMPKITFEGGHWTVLLYHYDCPRCREAVPEYERLALARKDRQIVLIETPPYGSDQSTEGAAIHVRLSDAREWFVQTPVEVCVDDGIVVSRRRAAAVLRQRGICQLNVATRPFRQNERVVAEYI